MKTGTTLQHSFFILQTGAVKSFLEDVKLLQIMPYYSSLSQRMLYVAKK
jgi:hypothetical protein